MKAPPEVDEQILRIGPELSLDDLQAFGELMSGAFDLDWSLMPRPGEPFGAFLARREGIPEDEH